MIIMVEGVDGSGKSTFIDKLTTRLDEVKKLHNIKIVGNAEILIPTHPKREDRLTTEDLVSKLIGMATDTSTIYVCDRGPISDIIYRTFDKYDPLLDLNTMLNIYHRNALGFLLVFCDTIESERLMKERGEDNPVAIQRHQELRYLYKQIMSTFNHYKYDLAAEYSIDLIINTILARVWDNLANFNKPTYQIRTIKKEEVQ